jgi:hypothetical protein
MHPGAAKCTPADNVTPTDNVEITVGQEKTARAPTLIYSVLIHGGMESAKQARKKAKNRLLGSPPRENPGCAYVAE